MPKMWEFLTSVSWYHRAPGTNSTRNCKIKKKCRESRDYYLSNGGLWLENKACVIESDVLWNVEIYFQLDITDIVKK